jgi:hypothetical protein
MPTPTSLAQYYSRHPEEGNTFVIALGLFSPCIQRFLRKRTIRWLNVGKKMLMGLSFSLVLMSAFIPLSD